MLLKNKIANVAKKSQIAEIYRKNYVSRLRILTVKNLMLPEF
jgi:hypothetical protein